MDSQKLSYRYCEELEDFFKKIDKFGGWPISKKYVGFEHTEERLAGFTDNEVNSGQWTTICDSDAYYWWKLSKEAKENIKVKFCNEMAKHLIRNYPYDNYYSKNI